MIKAVVGPEPSKPEPEAELEAYNKKMEAYKTKIEDLSNFLERVYHELRNLGMTPHERAINYAATNAYNVEAAFENAIKREMELDSIEVERSPICRPDSDCWDVKLYFFDPKGEKQAVRRVYRFTVDVSDVVPVMIGDMKTWSIR